MKKLQKNILTQSNLSLIVNDGERTLERELMDSLMECRSFQFNVAFVTFSCVQVFRNIFKELEDKGVYGKFITSTYLDFSEPKALRELIDIPNIELKVYTDTKTRGYHSKAYIFEREDDYKIIIGSSNFTTSALRKNVEWNASIIAKKDLEFARNIQEEYDQIWESLDYFTHRQVEEYSKFYVDFQEYRRLERTYFSDEEVLVPNSMQENAMRSLDFLRKQGETKALVIAATATGKTYMTVFDVKRLNPRRVLFVVHVENIIDSAMASFKRVLKDRYTYSKFMGAQKDASGDIVFTTNLTLNNTLEQFSPYDFDYIIVDEAHHATAETYQKFLNYFKPQFLLGMTATPERTDEGNIFEVFDRNVAIEVRLDEAIEKELVVPFHYYGITDIKDVDLSDVDLKDIDKVAKKLMLHSRTEFILEKMEFYKYEGIKLKGLGFCANVKHAEFMAEEFNDAGIESISISGQMEPSQRQLYFDRLEDDEDSLKMIFAVDVLNEGVDIPSVNLVLMLRPTNSPIVFTQQLGRGLRKHDGKTFLTVLDFIGNHNRAFLIAIALSGTRMYDKDSLKVMVDDDFRMGPKEVFVQIDEIAKERILEQLNIENFNTLKYLKEEYNNFKLIRQGRVPYYLMDYLGVPNAPDPLRFFGTSSRKTYFDFLANVEKTDRLIFAYQKNPKLQKAIYSLSSALPLVRPFEFQILKYLIIHGEVSQSELNNYITALIDGISEKTTEHALQFMERQYLDKSEIERYIPLIERKGRQIKLDDKLLELLNNDISASLIKDVIDYGLTRYYEEFSTKNYGLPFLKMYHPYSMRDVAMATNYTNKHSSFRGQGVFRFENHFYLFVDLHKDEDISESIKYKDKILSRYEFQWESQNSTSQSSRTGIDLIEHKKRGYDLHLFVRKQPKVDGKVLKYLYFGEVDVIDYKNNKPIMFKFRLHQPIPINIMHEMINVVE